MCGSGAHLLSTDERQRLGSITNAAAARRFLLGRILIRRGLARYLDADPRNLVIALGPHGQPVLAHRSEEHTSELQSLMRISYAVFCLKKNNNIQRTQKTHYHYIMI